MNETYNTQNNIFSYEQFLTENVELKKILSKVENLLTNERSEKISIQKIHEEFKSIHEKTKKELHDLSNKYINLNNEKLTLEKRFELELIRQKGIFDKQKEAYEHQLLRLSAFDSENIRNKAIFECENKLKEKMLQKDCEIEALNEEIHEYKRKNELLNSEFETMKLEAMKEIDMLKDSHKAEVRELLFKIQLLSEKNEQNSDKEAYRDLKNEYDLMRRQNTEYLAEINLLRREKEGSTLEKNDIRLQLMKDYDSEKLKNKIMEADYDRANHLLKNLEYENSYLKSKLEEKNDELRASIEEKFNYAKQLREKEIDFESFKAEIKVLRQKIEERDREINETINMSSEKEKHKFIQEKEEKDLLIDQIERLSLELRENQIEFKNFYERANEEIHIYKRDFYIVSEEKRNMQNRIIELQQELEFIKDEFDRKVVSINYLEKELTSTQEKYRELTLKEVENSKLLNEKSNHLLKKNEELEQSIKTNNDLVKMLKEGSYNDKRVKELIIQKEKYKQKVSKFLKKV